MTLKQAVEGGCRVGSFKLKLNDVAIFLVACYARKWGFGAIGSQKRLKIGRKLQI
jgi:hypothetical protein